MAAILDFTVKEAFLKENLGEVLCVILNSSTEANYIEKNLLTFLSNANYLHFLV